MFAPDRQNARSRVPRSSIATRPSGHIDEPWPWQGPLCRWLIALGPPKVHVPVVAPGAKRTVDRVTPFPKKRFLSRCLRRNRSLLFQEFVKLELQTARTTRRLSAGQVSQLPTMSLDGTPAVCTLTARGPPEAIPKCRRKGHVSRAGAAPQPSVAFEHREIAHRVAVVLPLLVEDHVEACQDGVLTVRMTRRVRGNTNTL